jgi:hypothetical protein
LVVRQEIKILVKTKQAGNSSQMFPNWRLSPNSGNSLDFCPKVENLKTLSYLDNVLCSMNRALELFMSLKPGGEYVEALLFHVLNSICNRILNWVSMPK